MKTIFITSFHVFVSRNILGSPLLDYLREDPDLKVVLIVPAKKVEYFQGQFAGRNILVQGIEPKFNRLDDIFREFAYAAIRTRARTLMRKMRLGFELWHLQSLFFWAPLVRSWIPFFYRCLVSGERYADLFTKYKPDLLFATDVFSSSDVILMHEAKMRGIKVIGMVRSWDNLVSKGGFRVIPDRLFVNNELIKKDALVIHGINPEIIEVVGIPHYDRYGTPVHSREQFYKDTDLNPKKRVILFAPVGDRYFRKNTFDPDILEILRDNLPSTHQLLVRCPPADTVNIGEVDLTPDVIIEKPGTHFGEDSKTVRKTEIGKEDEAHLMDTLAYSDVLICSATTLALDAFTFDLPVVFVGFDGKKGLPYCDTVVHHYEFEHFVPVVESAAAFMAKSVEEMMAGIKEYIGDRTKDRQKRKKILEIEGYHADKKSSERLYHILKSNLFQ